MQNLIPVNIIIGDRSYRIRIEPKDEETVRKLLKQINDKILEFKTQFAGKDMQDYVAMVLLWFVTELQTGGSTGLNDAFAEEMTKLEQMLDRTIGTTV